jgi:hypothetical protein
MKEMSLEQAVEFWKYLRDQSELKKQAFIDTPTGSPYKDEMRTEAETYQGLAKAFSANLDYPISSIEDICNGLTSEQTAGFLDFLNRRTIEFKTGLEKTQRNRQEALSKVLAAEYYEVKRIYKATEDNEERQLIAFDNARKKFMSILQGN